MRCTALIHKITDIACSEGASAGSIKSSNTLGGPMFGSNAINILIGLIVVFLAVGLTVSAGTEIVSHWFSMRPKQLIKALAGMIDGGATPGTAIPANGWFFKQTLLRSMTDQGNKFPSYMDPKTFSEALLLAIDKDFANKKAEELSTSLEQSLNGLPIDEKAKELIRNYIRQAKGDTAKFRELLEGWFDRVMDSASGWYKRNVAAISLILAVVIVVAANIDTFAIARALQGSDTLRAKMLEIAATLAIEGAASAPGATAAPTAAPCPPATPKPTQQCGQDAGKSQRQLEALKREFENMQQAGLPLGWDGRKLTFSEWLIKIVGLLITICAASLGAPFWFDMLSKVTNIRSAGPKPLTKTEVVSPPVKAGEH